MYFIYGEAELAYLRRKDKRLAAVIDRIGPVERTVDPDLFSAVVHHIIGQQISMKAQATIWQRMQDTLGTVSAETILAAGVPALQALGMTFRKAEYLTDLAGRIVDGSFDLEAVRSMDDAEAIRALSSLRGIGVWTAEMILLFCLQRPDIFSYDDLAIQRGLRMVYRHRRIDRPLPSLWQRGEPISVGRLRRRDPGADGPRAEERERRKIGWSIPQATPPRWAVSCSQRMRSG